MGRTEGGEVVRCRTISASSSVAYCLQRARWSEFFLGIRSEVQETRSYQRVTSGRLAPWSLVPACVWHLQHSARGLGCNYATHGGALRKPCGLASSGYRIGYEPCGLASSGAGFTVFGKRPPATRAGGKLAAPGQQGQARLGN